MKLGPVKSCWIGSKTLNILAQNKFIVSKTSFKHKNNHRPDSCHRATDTKNSSVHRCLANSVANWKVLSNFILVHFSNFLATKAN